MAKTKSRKATTTSASSKKIRIIAGVILLAIILVFLIIFGVTFTHSNGFAEAQRTFYVDVNGGRYYTGASLKLQPHSMTTFKCGYTTGNQNADKLYNIKITSTSTDKTSFTYTLNGSTRKFLAGEDYTDCFDITESANAFSISHANDTPKTILQRRYPGKTITTPETDPNISYFTLTISSADNSQSVSFALTFGDLKIELDPSGGIIF